MKLIITDKYTPKVGVWEIKEITFQELAKKINYSTGIIYNNIENVELSKYITTKFDIEFQNEILKINDNDMIIVISLHNSTLNSKWNYETLTKLGYTIYKIRRY